MTNTKLVEWGRYAFNKGYSIEDIEKYMVKRGLSEKEALNVVHQATSFEHNKIHEEVENVRKVLISIPILLILLFAGIMLMRFAGIV
ncbi:MAG TPA: hypothetical protein VJJ52_04500 [Candidatus Nanoarchaeia archaeon]|nr:hypothetical protein [Candidatus Nanoarchaeia archaeon]